MKPMITLFLVAMMQHSYAQQILIPYRKANLFGLSDTKGKIVVAPTFDHVEWLDGSWFQTTKRIELKDTLETKPNQYFIRNSTVKQTGLINKGKVVLSNEPFRDYEIVAGKCIVAESERRSTDLTKEQFKKYGDKRKFYSLFNLHGKNLFPENFKRIQKIDTTGNSSKLKGQGRYILFMVSNFQDQRSLIVFDADQQDISDWLVKDAYTLEANRFQSFQHKKQIVFNVTSKNYDQTNLLIDYSTGKFITKTLPVTETKKGVYGSGTGSGTGREERVQMVDIASGDYSDVKAIPEEGYSIPATKPTFQAYHQLIKDSLFYITGEKERNPVMMPDRTKIILREPRGMNQYDPVMARYNNQFYIIGNERFGDVGYDSLIYFGKYFIAFQKINGRSKAGVINADGSAYVPLLYDSLYAGIPYFDFENKNPAGKSNYQPVLKEADSKYNYEKRNPYSRNFSDKLTVFVNGKAGVINVKGDIIIPITYQMIAQNNVGHSRPREDEFILLKQQDKYGLTKLVYNKEKKQQEMGFTISPKFKYIPCYFYPHYYGIKDLKLVGLYDEHFVFKGFAGEDGKTYYQE